MLNFFIIIFSLFLSVNVFARSFSCELHEPPCVPDQYGDMVTSLDEAMALFKWLWGDRDDVKLGYLSREYKDVSSYNNVYELWEPNEKKLRSRNIKEREAYIHSNHSDDLSYALVIGSFHELEGANKARQLLIDIPKLQVLSWPRDVKRGFHLVALPLAGFNVAKKQLDYAYKMGFDEATLIQVQ